MILIRWIFFLTQEVRGMPTIAKKPQPDYFLWKYIPSDLVYPQMCAFCQTAKPDNCLSDCGMISWHIKSQFLSEISEQNMAKPSFIWAMLCAKNPMTNPLKWFSFNFVLVKKQKTKTNCSDHFLVKALDAHLRCWCCLQNWSIKTVWRYVKEQF